MNDNLKKEIIEKYKPGSLLECIEPIAAIDLANAKEIYLVKGSVIMILNFCDSFIEKDGTKDDFFDMEKRYYLQDWYLRALLGQKIILFPINEVTYTIIKRRMQFK